MSAPPDAEGAGTARHGERHGAAAGADAEGAGMGSDDERRAAGTDTDLERRKLIAWLWRLPVLAALGGGAYGVWRGWQVHFVKPPASAPTFTPGDPVDVAPIDAFAAPWSSVAFSYAGVPSVALRIPEEVPGSVPLPSSSGHLVAFSRICTHQGCIVDLNRSPEAIAIATNYRPEHPALVCGCHLSVFDPLAAGRAVAGPAQLPLARVQLAVDRGTVVAIGSEQG